MRRSSLESPTKSDIPSPQFPELITTKFPPKVPHPNHLLKPKQQFSSNKLTRNATSHSTIYKKPTDIQDLFKEPTTLGVTRSYKEITTKMFYENEKKVANEYEMEKFLYMISQTKLYDAIESYLQGYFNAKSVIYWEDIPSLQLFISERHCKKVEHNKGLIGQCFLTRQIMRYPQANLSTYFNTETDAIEVPENSSMVFFPIHDVNQTLIGIVQIIREKDAEWKEEDDEFLVFFSSKLRLYTPLFKTDINVNPFLLEIMQIMEVEQFLMIFQKQMTSLFGCKSAEIWEFSEIEMTYTVYKKAMQKLPIDAAGLVGDAMRRGLLVNIESNKMMSAHSARIDGELPEPVLILPIKDSVAQKTFAICLRGKQRFPVFTSKVGPFVIVALNNILKYSQRGNEEHLVNAEHSCIEAVQEIASGVEQGRTIEEIISAAMERAESITSADRATVFLYDRAQEKLVSAYSSGLRRPIVRPASSGIAGITFTTNKLVNVPDAYEDPNFDSYTDLETGYRTTSLLSVPMRSYHGECVGVLQLLNKLDGRPFSQVDISFSQILAHQLAVAQSMYEDRKKIARLSHKLGAFNAASNALTGSEDTKIALTSLLETAKSAVNCERAFIFLMDEVTGVLVTYITNGGEMLPTLPLSQGIAAYAATHKEAVSVKDAYHDPRFNKMPDFTFKYKSRTILAVPILNTAGACVGTIMVVNKKKDFFNDDDMIVVKSLSVFAGTSIEIRQLKTRAQKGMALVEASKWIGMQEMDAFLPPQKLRIEASRLTSVYALSFATIDWNGIGLFKLAFHIFTNFGILERFNISNGMFFRFLYMLRNTFIDIPYHNFIHALDSLQFVAFEVKQGNLDNIIGPVELLALLMAALSHDSGHNGFTSDYNRKAVTANGAITGYPAARASIVVIESEVLENMNTSDQRVFWGSFVPLVEAAAAETMEVTSELNEVLDRTIDLAKPSDMLTALCALVQLADRSFVTRPSEAANNWAALRQDELERMAEIAKELGVAPDPIPWASEVVFALDRVLPLLQAVVRFLPELQVAVPVLRANAGRWKET